MSKGKSSPSGGVPTGTIVCARVKHPSGRGNDIARFYLVISPTEENATEMVCLGISKQCPDPPPAHAVLLPFSAEPRSRPMTGLRQRCAVFVDWTIGVAANEVLDAHVGHVTQKLFNTIMDKYAKHQGS